MPNSVVVREKRGESKLSISLKPNLPKAYNTNGVGRENLRTLLKVSNQDTTASVHNQMKRRR